MDFKKCKTRHLYYGTFKMPQRYVHQRNTKREKDADQYILETPEAVLQKIKIARLYSFIFLAKRLVLILIVVLIPSSKSLFSYKISFLLLLQTAYIIYSIFIRSFDRSKDQIVEVLSEIVFFLLMILLTKFYSESKWTSVAVNVFIGVILSQLWILLFIPASICIFKLAIFFKWYKINKETCNSRETQNDYTSQIEREDSPRHLSINENQAQNKDEAPQNSESFVISANNHHDLSEEGKKRNHESEIYKIM